MLTTRLQIQTIADLLAGLGDTSLPLGDFSELCRTAYRAILDVRGPGSHDASPAAAQQALIRSLKDHPDQASIIRAIFAAVPGTKLDFPSLQEIAASLPEVTWLWPDWIPHGMITLLGAAPGTGKSYLALDLARCIIAGDRFPDGAPVPQPGANVIYVDAEDCPQIINRRAELWHMDTSRLFLMQPGERLFIDFSQTTDQDRLVEMSHSLAPALIVVDSLSTISSKGENNVEDVREVLGFLNRLALDAQCGLLLVHHLRKRGVLPLVDALSLDDFRGSSHIIAIPRSVLGLSIVQTGPQPDRYGPRRLEVVKTNLARYPQPIGVEFLPQNPDGVVLRYGQPAQQYHQPTKADECAEWLLCTLQEAGQPMKPAEVVELGEEAGFSRSMVYQARRTLGDSIRNTAGERNPRNLWALA